MKLNYNKQNGTTHCQNNREKSGAIHPFQAQVSGPGSGGSPLLRRSVQDAAVRRRPDAFLPALIPRPTHALCDPRCLLRAGPVTAVHSGMSEGVRESTLLGSRPIQVYIYIYTDLDYE